MKNTIISTAALLFLTVSSLLAAPLQLSGKARCDFSAKKAATPADVQKAKDEALHNGLDALMSSQSAPLRQLYEERKPDIYQTLLKKASQVEYKRKDSKEQGYVEISLTALLDDEVLTDTLMNASPTQSVVTLDDTTVALFFTVRRVEDVHKHDKVLLAQSAKSETVESAVAEAETSASASASETRTSKSSNSASTVTSIKSDTQKYELDSVARDEFGVALSARILDKGFENIVDGAMFDVSATLDEAYGQGNSVPASVWREICKEIVEQDPTVKYLIVGTLDFGSPRIDSMTSACEIDATITGSVYKLRPGKLPQKVAALSPVTNKARGVDEYQAKKRVLANMTPLASDEILAKLKAKNIIK